MKKTFKYSYLASILLFASIPGIAQAASLLEVYQQALQSDPLIHEAEARRMATLEAVPQARGRLLPQLNAAANYGTGSNSGLQQQPVIDPGTGDVIGFVSVESESDFDTFGWNAELRQTVFRWDQFVGLQQAQKRVAKAEVDFEFAQQDLIVRVVTRYFDVLAAEDRLTSINADRQAIARQLEQAKQRFEVGLIAITDVYETQAAFDGANTDVIVSRNSIDTAWEALLEIIGSYPREDLAQLRDPIELAMPEPADLDQWADTALEQNLLIESAFRSSELARKNIELQRSGHYPTLDLVGSYGTSDNSDSRTGSRANLGVIGLELNVPLYQGGGVSSAVRQARHDFEAAQDNLDAQRRSVNRTVKDAYRGVETSISTVQSLAATVVSSKSALEATEAGYEVGTRTIIDVLNVQRNLFESERNYAVARYRYVRSGLLLKQAASILSPDDIAAVNAMLQ